MKYLSYLVILLLSASCCGSKGLAQNATYKNDIAVLLSEAENKEATDDTLTETMVNTVEELDSAISESDSELEHTTSKSDQSEEIFDHSKWTTLLKKYVSDAGNVDYKGFKSDWKSLKEYIASLGKNMPNSTWSKNDKLAYWINAYNALTVDLIVRNYPVKSIKDIKGPWSQRLWKLGEKLYDLNEIEHQILRKMDEPRIHFGIVCASYSCPKLLNEAYISENLDDQLTAVTREFLADKNRNDLSENEIKLSKIFQWFAKDFKQNGTLIDFLNQYSEVSISSSAKKRFLDYNWDLNE
ncbi:MAG: DUF547 domain-containing protein [Flavobacteriaceae bacterium]|nr:DUF547 domain-containing protein [Flavobacteriaceae bacterium]